MFVYTLEQRWEVGQCYAAQLETIDSFNDNILEAIGEMQLHTIDNVF